MWQIALALAIGACVFIIEFLVVRGLLQVRRENKTEKPVTIIHGNIAEKPLALGESVARAVSAGGVRPGGIRTMAVPRKRPAYKSRRARVQ